MVIPVVLNVAICIPARNERENLPLLLREIEAAIDHPVVGDCHLVIFDDGSDDGTFEYLRSESLLGVKLQVLRSSVRVGKATALRHAISEAVALEADAIITMDADLEDDPSYIPALLEALIAGCDMVNACPVNRQSKVSKMLSSSLFNGAARASTGVRLNHIDSGYKAFSRSAAQAISPYLYGELHRVVLIVAVWMGLNVGEVKVNGRPRKFGKTKNGITGVWRGIFDLWTFQFLRRYHSSPGHFFSGVGGLMVLTGVIIVVWSLVGVGATEVLSANPYALSIGVLLILGGGIFISFGFLAELMLFLLKAPPTGVIYPLRTRSIPPLGARGQNSNERS